MGKFFFDLFSGKTGFTISDNMAIDEGGDLLMRTSDNTAMDLDTGGIHIISSNSGMFDDDDEW